MRIYSWSVSFNNNVKFLPKLNPPLISISEKSNIIHTTAQVRDTESSLIFLFSFIVHIQLSSKSCGLYFQKHQHVTTTSDMANLDQAAIVSYLTY